MPVKIQAINSKAKAMAASSSQASRATSHLQNDARRRLQFDSLPKRENPGNTGQTPPPKAKKPDGEGIVDKTG